MNELPNVRDLMRRGFTGSRLVKEVQRIMGGSEATVEQWIAAELGEEFDDVITTHPKT